MGSKQASRGGAGVAARGLQLVVLRDPEIDLAERDESRFGLGCHDRPRFRALPQEERLILATVVPTWEVGAAFPPAPPVGKGTAGQKMAAEFRITLGV